MSVAPSAVASPRADEPWLVDSNPKPAPALRKEDALERPDFVLRDAIVVVTERHQKALRKRRSDDGVAGGGLDNLHVASYDRKAYSQLLQNLTQASGVLCVVDQHGTVREDYDKMNQFASDILEVCFELLPDEEEAAKLASANPMTAFQAVYKARAAREQVQEKCRATVQEKTAEEIRLTRRLIRTAREMHKPPVYKPKGALVQAAFLKGMKSNDDDEGKNPYVQDDTLEGDWLESSSQRNGSSDALVLDATAPSNSLQNVFAAKKFARSLISASRADNKFDKKIESDKPLIQQKASLLAPVDPYDDSVFGVTNRAVHLVRQNTRVLQSILEFLLGYCSAVDPEDLNDIEAGSRGLRAAEGKSLRELSLKYAAHLDATLPDRHKVVLTVLVRNCADEHHAHATLGADAEDRYEARAFESAGAVREKNRVQWTKSMFPDAPWPKTESSSNLLDQEQHRTVLDGANGAQPGALVNPLDPDSGVVGGRGSSSSMLTGGGDFPGSVVVNSQKPKVSFREQPVRIEQTRSFNAHGVPSIGGMGGMGNGDTHQTQRPVYSNQKGWGEESAHERPSWL